MYADDEEAEWMASADVELAGVVHGVDGDAVAEIARVCVGVYAMQARHDGRNLLTFSNRQDGELRHERAGAERERGRGLELELELRREKGWVSEPARLWAGRERAGGERRRRRHHRNDARARRRRWRHRARGSG